MPTGRARVAGTANSGIGYLKLGRMLISTLPIKDVAVKALFNVLFNLIVWTIGKTSYGVGAYAMFGVGPGALLKNSPLVAKDTGGKFSIPGHPVSMKWISFKIRNTTKMSEHSGRWAAVFIPYRELHDKTHYQSLMANMSFTDIAAMPYAKVAIGDQDIFLMYRMKDRTAYCARPREVDEEIGIVFIAWDNSSRNATVITSALENSDFNCEIEMNGGCVPHVIFGPNHRVLRSVSDFEVRSVTQAEVRLHKQGRVELISLDEYRRLRQRELEEMYDEGEEGELIEEEMCE